MEEIYWITRLDDITVFFSILIAICAISAIIFILGYFSLEEESCGSERDVLAIKKCKKRLLLFVFIGVSLGAINVFIPSTKDAYLIYGLGGTIDYVKSNDKAKKLPDKCINALDRLVDNMGIEEKDSIE